MEIVGDGLRSLQREARVFRDEGEGVVGGSGGLEESAIVGLQRIGEAAEEGRQFALGLRRRQEEGRSAPAGNVVVRLLEQGCFAEPLSSGDEHSRMRLDDFEKSWAVKEHPRGGTGEGSAHSSRVTPAKKNGTKCVLNPLQDGIIV